MYFKWFEDDESVGQPAWYEWDLDGTEYEGVCLVLEGGAYEKLSSSDV